VAHGSARLSGDVQCSHMGVSVSSVNPINAKCCCAEDVKSGQRDVYDPTAMAAMVASEEVVAMHPAIMHPPVRESDMDFVEKDAAPAQVALVHAGPFWTVQAPEQTPEAEVPIQPTNPNEFTILLERTSRKSRLGLSLDTASGGPVVDKVDGGLVGAWNATNPDLEVRPGDRVVSVNGWSADHVALTQMCERHDNLEVTVLRMVFRRRLSPGPDADTQIQEPL